MGKCHFRLSVLLLCLAGLMGACSEFNEDPGVPTEKTMRGWITAGETGDRVISSDFPITYCFDCQYVDPLEYLNAENGGSLGTIAIPCSYNSNENTEFYQASIYPMQNPVEYAKLDVVDSVMICYDINSDTTSGTITHSNVFKLSDCNHPWVFEKSRKLTTPQPYPAGTRINSTLPWTTEFGMFNRHHHTTIVHGDLVTREVQENLFWEQYGGQYVAIRTRRGDGDGYRYGYMEVGVFADHVILYRIAMEK